jgi:hypothetical protein
MEKMETTEMVKGQRRNRKRSTKGTQKRRYDEERAAKKITKTANLRVLYWNVAALRKTEEEFWDYVRQFEIVGLVETWVEEQSWEKIVATERVPMGMSRGKTKKEKRKSCRGNNNRGINRQGKGRKKRMYGNFCTYRQ